MQTTIGGREELRLEVHDSIGSTNDEAMDRARDGDPGGLWIVARRQTRGKGRLGRTWASPEGNLHASVLLVDPCRPADAPELGFVAGLALARAVEDVAGPDFRFHIKWPNDLVRDGAKFAGVLIEGTRTPAGAFAAVLGFGVNCASHPAGLDSPATDLSDVREGIVAPPRLLPRLMDRVDEALSLWSRGDGFAAVRTEWLERALPRGSKLVVKLDQVRQAGHFSTIDERGRLVLATPKGMMTVGAADVFLTDPVGPAAFGPR